MAVDRYTYEWCHSTYIISPWLRLTSCSQSIFTPFSCTFSVFYKSGAICPKMTEQCSQRGSQSVLAKEKDRRHFVVLSLSFPELVRQVKVNKPDGQCCVIPYHPPSFPSSLAVLYIYLPSPDSKQNKRQYGTKRPTVGETIMIASNFRYIRRWLTCYTDGNDRSIYENQNTILSLPNITTYFHFVPQMPPYGLVYPSKKQMK